MTREEIIQQICDHKIIVIARGLNPDHLIPFAEAVYAGGIRLIELTYNTDADEVIAGHIKTLVDHFGDRMLIGAGTVLTARQVELTKVAGGSFVISPDTNAEIIRRTVELGLVSIPGAFTPTEIMTAHHAGADFVKLFPAFSVGPAYVKAVKAPLSHIRLLAVGSVTPELIPEYEKAGACGFGIAGKVVNKAWMADGRYDLITAEAQKYTDALS